MSASPTFVWANSNPLGKGFCSSTTLKVTQVTSDVDFGSLGRWAHCTRALAELFDMFWADERGTHSVNWSGITGALMHMVLPLYSFLPSEQLRDECVHENLV